MNWDKWSYHAIKLWGPSKKIYVKKIVDGAANSLINVNICLSYLVIQKDEIHLYEYECHSGGWCEREQHVVAVGVTLQLPVLTKLQSRVDHWPNAESYRQKYKDVNQLLKEELASIESTSFIKGNQFIFSFL